MEGKWTCEVCGDEMDFDEDEGHELADGRHVCASCFENFWICALCDEEIDKSEEKGHELFDGRRVCDACFESSCECCSICGKECHEDDLQYFGDDMLLCPDCFAEEFPEFDEKKNNEETQEAYEAFKARLIGKRTNLEGPGGIICETEMDEDAYRWSVEVTLDENGCIGDVSRIHRQRCQSIAVTMETWLDIPVDNSDYKQDCNMEWLIREELELDEDNN